MKYNALHQQFSFESIFLQLQLLCFDFHISEIALLSCVPLKVCSCHSLGSFADCNIPSPCNVWETGSRQQHGCGVPTACASEFVVHSDFACFNTNFHYLEWESIFEYIGYVMKKHPRLLQKKMRKVDIEPSQRFRPAASVAPPRRPAPVKAPCKLCSNENK